LGEPLFKRVAKLRWYHTLELPGGIVTPGDVDTRAAAGRVPFPSLEGKRCLDIGTMNGFWAFEMERRGAAEVVALDVEDPRDLDWPPRTRLLNPNASYESLDHVAEAFHLAREALDSRVERLVMRIDDLSPATVDGFDFVFIGGVLVHLRDPIGGLDRIREICLGDAIVFDLIDLTGSLLSRRTPRATLDARHVWWWSPNLAALTRMIESAGWELVKRSPVLTLPRGPGATRPSLGRLLRSHPNMLFAGLAGDPHVAWYVRPLRAPPLDRPDESKPLRAPFS
jgi:tRNA (mo5U34)-methyltransferase